MERDPSEVRNGRQNQSSVTRQICDKPLRRRIRHSRTSRCDPELVEVRGSFMSYKEVCVDYEPFVNISLITLLRRLS